MKRQPLVSVIIPVYNAVAYLEKCITAIRTSTYSSYEIIIVDDASTDDSPEIARKLGATILQLPTQSGPAAARNYGAKKAKGDILLFIDSDVLVTKDTIVQVAKDFTEDLDIAAVFGSYDDDPAEKNFLSQYKNLLHHFVHQQSSTKAVTFWAGCGAIRKQAFDAVGGFDEKKYSRPCIEDIELGHRLTRMGYRILLDKDLQVKHLKEWRLRSLLRADIFYRAVPWTRLMLESQDIPNDLNLKFSQRISAALVGLAAGFFLLSLFKPNFIYPIPLCLLAVFALNHNLFNFLLRRKGFKFVLLAFPMQLLYYIYSATTFALCWIHYRIRLPLH